MLNKYSILVALVIFLMGSSQAYADEIITYENCMQHLGGGGFGDFDCYEMHVRNLRSDNTKIANSLKSAGGITVANKRALDAYMRAQDDVASACNLAINLEYPSAKERAKRDHIELYDVMAARCRYTIRKQENDFLHDLRSITNN
ncbi:hypothetical protein [Paraburkholderia bannensis]|uniref:hypothetical protein n=1 Tax=Paraburkholderia bannensis TaxID=765414 RepID=UPI002ABE7484|nr:hypothetical protein [Paraburkholderia bannensis]